MNQNKLTFELENLVVDYISFNISGLIDPKPIANYLSGLGFNSILKSNEKTRGEVLVSEKENDQKVTFVKSNYDPVSKSYWNGLIVRFSGKNGHSFYQLIRRKLVNWDVFDLSCTNLGRFDVHFLKDLSKSKPSMSACYAREGVGLFMENSCRKAKSNFPKIYAEYFEKKNGLLLEIGSRGSNHRLRVYEKKNYLEFELEIKKVAIQSYQGFLFSDNLEEFETKLINHYYKQLKKWLPLDSFYMDWFLVGLRKLVFFEGSSSSTKQRDRLNYLVSSYLSGDTLNYLVQKERFFQLLQLLSFLRTLSYSVQLLDDQGYCVVEFAMMDFINFTGNNSRSTYQRKKALDFFASLQEIKPLIQRFSSSEFRKSVVFPYLKLRKKNRRWTLNIAIVEELYFYPYPFFFPASFLRCSNKYDLKIKLGLIESFSTTGLEKRFPLESF